MIDYKTKYEINDKLIDQIESTITHETLLRLTYEINRLDKINRQIMSVLSDIVQKNIKIDDILS